MPTHAAMNAIKAENRNAPTNEEKELPCVGNTSTATVATPKKPATEKQTTRRKMSHPYATAFSDLLGAADRLFSKTTNQTKAKMAKAARSI